MDKLTRPGRNSLERRLQSWNSPDAAVAIVDSVDSQILFTQGGLAFLRDGWVAGEFGGLRGADGVRLVSDRWPDFELQFGHRSEAFECVEADDPNRRRGDEYRNGIGEIEDDGVEDWVQRAQQVPDWIRRTVGKKLAKGYSERRNLVIYLNMTEYGIRQREVECCFESATSEARSAFSSVWILWKKKAYPVWQ